MLKRIFILIGLVLLSSQNSYAEGSSPPYNEVSISTIYANAEQYPDGLWFQDAGYVVQILKKGTYDGSATIRLRWFKIINDKQLKVDDDQVAEAYYLTTDVRTIGAPYDRTEVNARFLSGKVPNGSNRDLGYDLNLDLNGTLYIRTASKIYFLGVLSGPKEDGSYEKFILGGYGYQLFQSREALLETYEYGLNVQRQIAVGRACAEGLDRLVPTTSPVE